MIKPKSFFLHGMKITQQFGNKDVYEMKNYYNRFGMDGHNGIDVVPERSGDDWIFCPWASEFVAAGWDDGFGNYIVLYDSQANIKSLYAHLKEIWILDYKKGDRVPFGLKLGRMGSTGNSFGDHLHYQIKQLDDKGNILNYNNGYFGAIDPINYLINKVA
jgi:murein DD-endopeptidase MepM/ murein hydrolase activator NlpD